MLTSLVPEKQPGNFQTIIQMFLSRLLYYLIQAVNLNNGYVVMLCPAAKNVQEAADYCRFCNGIQAVVQENTIV